MRLKNKIAAALLGLLAFRPLPYAAIIGGTYYAVQYDYREFFAATDGRNFQVILAGNPSPASTQHGGARSLPAMQAAKPRPALTFTYDAPVERPRPDYRLVLIFDPATTSLRIRCAAARTRFKRAGRASSTSMPSIAATTWRCRRRLPGRPRPARRSAHRRAVPRASSRSCSAILRR